MKKRLLVLPLVAMSLAGCGGSPNPEPGPNPDPAPVQKVVESIAVKTQPAKRVYLPGESFDASGMVLTVNYVGGTSEDVTSGWTINPAGALNLTDTKITVSYEGKSVDVAITVKPLAKYTVTFMANATDKIKDVVYNEGETPSCDYSVPSTQEYVFTMLGWSLTPNGTVLSSLPKVTGDATYYAIVSKTKQKYEISFKYDDGTDYKKVSVEYGSVPTVTAPTKAKTQQYSYTFVGWSETKGGEVLASLPKVTGPATYYASFQGILNQYTIHLDVNCEEDDAEITDNYGTTFENFDEYVPEREGYHFAGWCLDEECEQKVTFPVTLTKDVTYYAKWNEKVDVLGYLKSLLKITTMSPYDFVPETMMPTFEDNYIEESDKLDFSTSQNVSKIKKTGFGEQWQMVIDNLNQSETFYKVLSGADGVISAAAAAFLNWFESNPDSTNHSEKTSLYDASCSFNNGVLVFGIAFLKSITLPVVGSICPVVNMTYDVENGEKTVVISINDYNELKCSFAEEGYIFGIQYGIESLYRTAYCQFDKFEDDDENITYEGHIYEHINAAGKDRLSSAADFYIDDTYCSVVGNKADGIMLMDSYINELYDVSNGYLLGYKVMETKTLFGFTGQYNTLWFNLYNITGVNSIKVTKKSVEDIKEGLNPDYIYVNGSDAVFEVARNSKAFIPTSRKYDVEMRKHFYYGLDGEEKLSKYSVEIPMMFIQDDNDKDSNFTDFPADMNKVSGISGASVTLSSTHLQKIRDDYDELIPIFKEHKDKVSSEAIIEWLK